MNNEIFSRHIPVWGLDKERIINNSAVLVAGIGGLGTTVSQILVRAGIGKLYIVDNGRIDLPDLNRQSLYFWDDIGKKKVDIACLRLKSIHNQTNIIPIHASINTNFELPNDVSGVVDCLDNYESRFYLETLLPKSKFYIHGGVQNDYGQVISLIKGKSKSLKEIFANSQNQKGVLAVTPPIVFSIASIMAQETINCLWNKPKLLDEFLIVEFSDFSWFKLKS